MPPPTKALPPPHVPCARRALAATIRGALGAVLLWLVIGGVSQLHAAPPPAPVHTIEEFYQISAESAKMPHPICWDIEVLYSDPGWNLLWVENAGFGTFIPTNKDFPRYPRGQRLRVEGTLVPATGITLAGTRVTPLPEKARLAPLLATGRLPDFDRFDNRLVVLEALVDRQSEADPSHLMLEASAEGFHIVVRVQIAPKTPRPNLEGQTIRAAGVYVGHRDFAGKLTSIALWVDSLADVEALGALSEDTAFTLPLLTIEAATATANGGLVHVAGTVHSFDNTSATITLRDDTGQIEIATAQSRDIRIGTALEAVGVPVAAGIHRKLLNARVRPTGAPAAGSVPGDRPVPLRLADQVLALEPEAADRGRPALLFGVATWLAPDRRSMFVQDVSGAVEVRFAPLAYEPPQVPCSVRIVGRTARGELAPLVVAESLSWINPLGSPEARNTTLDEMLAGYLHGRWVATRAFLRGVRHAPQETILDLTSTSGEFVAILPDTAQIVAAPGSILSLRGVCSVTANARHHPSAIRLLVPGAQHINIELPTPADPFALPARTLAGLRAFGPADSTLRRVRTHGTVLYHEPGRQLCLQDGTDSLLVLSRDPAPLRPGDQVEVVGLPGMQGSRMVLREATYRRAGPGEEPAALEVTRVERADATLDGRLVRLRGSIVALDHRPDGGTIAVQAADRRFAALIPGAVPAPVHGPVGAVVALTGVYRAIYDEYRQPIDFHLQLRTPADIVVLQAPPLLTIERSLWIVGGLVLVTVAVLGWLAVLRARVAQQTAQIRTQLEHQAGLEAELQKAQRIESLGLLAGGIAHDFNNLLTGILGNLSLARLEAHGQQAFDQILADAELAALRARDLTQQLLVFTKGGTPARSVVRLPELARESVALALHGYTSSVRTEFDFPADLRLAHIDRVQIGQVLQNLAINAAQAMPRGGALNVAAANETIVAGAHADLAPGRYLRIRVSDTGTGIAPDLLPKIFDPYFTTKKTGTGLGLATVFSMVRRHGGHIEVESDPGRGTTFRLWLPAAETDQPSIDQPSAAAISARSPAPVSARLLVVEADMAIRRMAMIVLLRAGYEVTAVAAGREAIELARAAVANGQPYRLALLDLTAPDDLGAKEIQTELHTIDPQLPLVLSTGRSDDSLFTAHREHGFAAVLSKPYDAQDLVALVAAVLCSGRDKREA